MKGIDTDVLSDVPTSLTENVNPNGSSTERTDVGMAVQIGKERRSKKKADVIINVEDIDSDEEPIATCLAQGMVQRLEKRKRKSVVMKDSDSAKLQRKYESVKDTKGK